MVEKAISIRISYQTISYQKKTFMTQLISLSSNSTKLMLNADTDC